MARVRVPFAFENRPNPLDSAGSVDFSSLVVMPDGFGTDHVREGRRAINDMVRSMREDTDGRCTVEYAREKAEAAAYRYDRRHNK